MTPEVGVLAALIVIFVLFAAVNPVIATRPGIANFLDPAATLGIMAIAVALLMIGGDFDLSAGVMIGSTALVTALVSTQFGVNIWVGIFTSLVFAILVGLFNGFIVHYTRLPSFIVTLSTMFMLWGLNYAIAKYVTNSVTISGVGNSAGYDGAKMIFGSSAGGFQVSLIWWIILTGVGAVILARTTLGNWITAVGGNSAAASAVGVPVHKVQVALFVTTSVAAWLVGTMTVVRYGSATVTTGIGSEFNFIIAAVIGGCLLMGGAGSVIGASLGALMFGLVQQGMPLVGLPTELFKFVLGAILLGAVLINLYIKRKAQVAT